MMNKNENVINDEKVNIFKYEMSKIKSTWSKVFLITIVIQLLSFMFFSVVGKFDGSSDTISSFQGIIALSNTVTMCGISIYGAVLLRKELVRFYIGDQRNRTFLFPVDRKDLIMKKTSSFFTIILTSFGSALFVSFIVEVVLNLFLKFDSSNIIFEMYLGFVVIVTSCILLFLILILSELISIWKQSEITTVITAVVLMLMFSNFSAMGLMNFPTVTFVSSVMMGLLFSWIFIEFSKTLNKMEVY
ncbi:accessory regulator AgrC [Vagococcus carniphilus]|uniref:Accessory regulator AgrC n=1 Tax=Vagococcus carniphilus TaxID=218144 RepID=A0A430B664_9ENTE|nr:accessory regulator AgrC [Vagococcus carniphilus]QNN72697.1 accessory regulator AgrC [Vagococcus carniphilus]RSU15803.1 accessory regulator AgrC [Vagococcus carniphilus]